MDRKIAVIGAGPAGITAALELQDRGFTDVTIFGFLEEAQLKTIEVDGVTFDVAACLLHTGYWNTVIPLAKRYGINVNFLSIPADLVDQNLHPIKNGFSQILETYLAILFYTPFFLGWWILHRTPFLKRYSTSMESFLNRRGMESLAQSFAMGPGGIGQGYGFLDEVTAYHAMRWFRPRLFLTPLLSKFGLGVATLTQGYETLFTRILAELNHVESRVKMVQPIHGQVELILDRDERRIFDEVIIACPLDRVAFPHAYLVTPETIDETSLFSYLFTSPTPPPFSDRAYFVDLIEQKTKDKALVIRTGGKTITGDFLYWAVGYKSKKTPFETLRLEIEHQLINDCGFQIKQVHFFDYFRYNLRFSSTAIKEGLPWLFKQLQGEKHLWYSGGLMSHWDISSIYEYNKQLVNKIHYRNQEKTVINYLKFKWKAFLSWIRLI